MTSPLKGRTESGNLIVRSRDETVAGGALAATGILGRVILLRRWNGTAIRSTRL